MKKMTDFTRYKMTELRIECENIYKEQNVKIVETAKKIFNFYLTCPEITDNFCLKKYDYDSVSFDFLLCNGEKNHQINKEYRNKDYSADIITFAVFADSDENERFVLDGEINLGEIIIAIDKIEQSAKEKNINYEAEMAFFIAHGILHLLGFDHQDENSYNFVVKYQKEALRRININYDKV